MRLLHALTFATSSIILVAAACSDDQAVGPSPTGSTSSGSTSSGSGGNAGQGGAAATGGNAGAPPANGDVTVKPVQIDNKTMLVNPGMGLANFHFGWWCNLPPVSFTPAQCVDRVVEHWPVDHPDTGTAYFRWSWRQIEPKRNEIDFAMIDNAIQSANLLGETFSFRIMTVSEGAVGLPQWLLDPPYSAAGNWLAGDAGNTFWPDYRNAAFQSEHARLIDAIAQRYNDHPAVDHVDIGSVGCWGEWNTACLNGGKSIIEIYDPPDAAARQAIVLAYQQLIDHHLKAFTDTPLVMLGLDGTDELELLLHAVKGGTGWRVDCWGDWGIWGGNWSHHDDLYPNMLASATSAWPAFAQAWQKAPVQLEVCGTMPGWQQLGWSATAPDGKVHKTFQWALEQHASVLNAKFTTIPGEYLPALQDLLTKNGYRFAVDSFNHNSVVSAGGPMSFSSTWSNLGVAPAYLRRKLSYRLRGETTVSFDSAQDTRAWLPGSWTVSDTFTVPAELPAGSYAIELALLDRAGENPATAPLPSLKLAISDRRDDGWYPISELKVE